MSTSTRSSPKAPVTLLLEKLRRGYSEVQSELARLVYPELRRIAAGYMRRERVDHTLETGGLVNEAWIRLAADGGPDFKNRNHFFAIAAGHMRQILVDHARRHNAQKRGGAAYKVTLSDVHAARSESGLLDVIAVHEAMTRFAELDPRACRILEMHLFAGMRQDEIADVLGLSIRTVRRDLMAALAWLRRELGARKNRASR